MIPDGVEKSYMKEMEHPWFSSLNEYVSVTDTCLLRDLTKIFITFFVGVAVVEIMYLIIRLIILLLKVVSCT